MDTDASLQVAALPGISKLLARVHLRTLGSRLTDNRSFLSVKDTTTEVEAGILTTWRMRNIIISYR
jgi:hypothetical protein